MTITYIITITNRLKSVSLYKYSLFSTNYNSVMMFLTKHIIGHNYENRLK